MRGGGREEVGKLGRDRDERGLVDDAERELGLDIENLLAQREVALSLGRHFASVIYLGRGRVVFNAAAGVWAVVGSGSAGGDREFCRGSVGETRARNRREGPGGDEIPDDARLAAEPTPRRGAELLG